MQLYEKKFDDALAYLKRPDILSPTGDNPICYVNYQVEDGIVLHRMISTTLKPKANFHGFSNVTVLSIGQCIQDFVKSHEYWSDWTDEGNDENDIIESIREELTNGEVLANRILQEQDELLVKQNPLLILCDLELLHPYDKMGRIEQVIYNKIKIPIMVLYPGEAQGTARTFLNIYPMDGSYRSRNF